MTTDEAEKCLREAILVTREDVARAKAWIVNTGGGRTDDLLQDWLNQQKATVLSNSKVDMMSERIAEEVAEFARVFSIRLAFHQAQWELIAAAEMFPGDAPTTWEPNLGYQFGGVSGGLNLKGLGCSFPPILMRPPLSPEPSTDADIFLRGICCSALHIGIREAIKQSLFCYQRGLYMPAIAMLAAAAEATWTECGMAIAKKLPNTKLDSTVNDPFASISQKVAEIQKTLTSVDGRTLLKSVGSAPSAVNSAELWTTNLRERRNALHWGKVKSFIVDHSETASLLMGAPQHIGTLEAIRAGC